MLHLGRSQMLPTILNLYKRTGNDSNQSISHMIHVQKFFVSFFLKSKHLRRDKPRAVSRLRQRGEGLQEDHQVTLNWGGMGACLSKNFEKNKALSDYEDIFVLGSINFILF